METAIAAREKRRQTALNRENPFLAPNRGRRQKNEFPPILAHRPLFEKICSGVNAVRISLNKALAGGLKIS